MTYDFTKMSQKQAEDIALNWHYDGDYSFYDMEADQEDLAEFLDVNKRRDYYYVVKKENEIIGFMSFIETATSIVDIGLGLKPKLTGHGLGLDFLRAGLNYAKTKYKPQKITLSVAIFNKRAIKVYKKAGFVEGRAFMQNTNGGSFEFIFMEFDCSSSN
ncbi:GNAT family protein [Cytobacillus sp. IB215316]|uniref:GNAT family N-acetyltransferase n=1 Tax=Cytobacillus sp. IB215316 TaxID=3097354 RepID=UPI002A0CAEE0|nr:GNAT family protein [Cytobacillus sp. IB215316]MDX8361476.1 GNAT family protein [Cytobacillus sp. IB215316]